MMMQNKIYLVTGFSREPHDSSSCVIGAFISKELAEKVANGLDDVTDSLISQWEVKEKERDEKLASIVYLLDEQYDEQAALIYEEYEKYEIYWTFFYQVKEIDLIN